MTVSGVTLPLSSAADAVTTLKVEPGGYSSWVVRFSSGLFGSRVELPKSRRDQVRVVLGDRDHHAHLAGLRLERHHRALAAGEARHGGLRARHVEVRDDVVALAVAALEAGQDRGELVLLADQVVVAVELEPAPARSR